jgi:hypothetical protein
MRQVPVRDPHGTIVALAEPGLFASGDDPPPIPPAPPAPPATGTPAPGDPNERPRRPRSSLDEELNGHNNIVRNYGLVALAIVIALAAVFYLRWQQVRAVDAATETATATATATPWPVSTPTLPNAVVAYAAPDGVVVGALEAGRVYTMIARSGRAWVQIDVGTPDAPNIVWVKAEELFGSLLDATLVDAFSDLATPTALPTPTEIPYVPPPRPVYVPPPTPNWPAMPIVGRAESPDGVLICESRISQADAERCLAELLAQTTTP